MKTNIKKKEVVFTHEGAVSTKVPPLQQLRRLTMACMLWEDTFYVDGKKSAELIEEVCKQVKGEDIVALAVDCHKKGLLRHVPLWLIVQALKKGAACKEAIYEICNRPDQMTELLSLYWKDRKDGKKRLAKQLQKGLAKAFTRFDEYQLAKYNRDGPIKLRDVLFLSHARPKDEAQAELWKKLVSKTLATPETWETKLSAGEDKKESFAELLEKKKMGKLAILRNLRNMHESGVSKELVEREMIRKSRPMLPFQFLAAAQACPQWEDIVDKAMIESLAEKKKLGGITTVLVDVSGSMNTGVSGKSKMSCMDAACALAILLREICSDVDIFTFSNNLVYVPARHGMALRDVIKGSQHSSGTYLGNALSLLLQHKKPGINIDRIIVITDEQSHDQVPRMGVSNCYVLNVAGYQNGINNNGEWMTISGFSEHCIDYIQEIEKEDVKEDVSDNVSGGVLDEQVEEES